MEILKTQGLTYKKEQFEIKHNTHEEIQNDKMLSHFRKLPLSHKTFPNNLQEKNPICLKACLII